jgi:predicted HNH restriction endonuclease
MRLKKTTLLFSASLALTLISSCVNNVKEQSQKWNPYKEYDKLEFVSKNGERSSIQITEIATTDDNGNELISINALFEIIDTNTANNTYAKTFLMALTANPDGDDYISFNILSPNHEFFSYPAIKSNKLDSLKTTTAVISGKTYDDVLSLDPSVFQSKSPEIDIPNKINTMLWSKKEGLLEYTTMSGKTWTLIKKTSKSLE